MMRKYTFIPSTCKRKRLPKESFLQCFILNKRLITFRGCTDLHDLERSRTAVCTIFCAGKLELERSKRLLRISDSLGCRGPVRLFEVSPAEIYGFRGSRGRQRHERVGIANLRILRAQAHFQDDIDSRRVGHAHAPARSRIGHFVGALGIVEPDTDVRLVRVGTDNQVERAAETLAFRDHRNKAIGRRTVVSCVPNEYRLTLVAGIRVAVPVATGLVSGRDLRSTGSAVPQGKVPLSI